MPDTGRREHLSVKEYGSRRGGIGSGQDLGDGRLASSVFANKSVNFAGKNLKADSVNRAHGTEMLYEIRDLEQEAC
jgi:hypothetical protein